MGIDDQSEQQPRRRSLLPQRSIQRSTLNGMEAVNEHPSAKAEGAKATRIKGTKVETRPPTRTVSMLPPPNVERSRSVRERGKPSSLQRPSTLQSLQKPAQAGNDSTGRPPQRNADLSHHGRSVNHQIQQPNTPGASLRNPLNRNVSTRSQRPDFTAMQRSFTPKKTFNSRPSSSCSEPAGKDDIPSADVSHLQMDIAQLHLLHRSAHSVQMEWQQSAQNLLHKRFDALRERHVELNEISQQQQTLIDRLALVNWSQNKSGAQVADKVAVLSRIITDVCSLTESDGKYTRILEVFESWFALALETREHRKPGSEINNANVDVIDGIGDGWKAEAMVLERELTYSLRDLKAFGPVQPNSSLGQIQHLYSTLIVNLIEELDIIQWIESEVTAQETTWIESTIQGLASDVTNDIGRVASLHGHADR